MVVVVGATVEVVVGAVVEVAAVVVVTGVGVVAGGGVVVGVVLGAAVVSVGWLGEVEGVVGAPSPPSVVAVGNRGNHGMAEVDGNGMDNGGGSVVVLTRETPDTSAGTSTTSSPPVPAMGDTLDSEAVSRSNPTRNESMSPSETSNTMSPKTRRPTRTEWRRKRLRRAVSSVARRWATALASSAGESL